MIVPQVIGCGSPSPRNASAVSSKIAMATVSTVFAISSGPICGSTWRKMMPAVAGAQRARALDVDAFADALHLRPDDPRRRRPQQHGDHEDQVRQAGAPDRRDDDRERKVGDHEEVVGEPHQDACRSVPPK